MEKKNINILVKELSDTTLAVVTQEVENWAKTGLLSNGVLRQLARECEPWPGCDADSMLRYAETTVLREAARRFSKLQHRQVGREMIVVMENDSFIEDVILVKNWNDNFKVIYSQAVEEWQKTDDELFSLVFCRLKEAGYEFSSIDFQSLYTGE